MQPRRSRRVRCSAWLGVMFQQIVRIMRVWQAGGGSTLNRWSYLTDNMHANATLTPLMRAKMVLQHAAFGRSLRASAAAFGVSEKNRPQVAPARPAVRLSCAPGRSLLQTSASAAQNSAPTRSPNPRSPPPTPLLCPDPHGPSYLKGFPFPHPPAPGPQSPGCPRSSQATHGPLRTRHARRAPSSGY